MLPIRKVYEQRHNPENDLIRRALDTVLMLPQTYLGGAQHLHFASKRVQLSDLDKLGISATTVTFTDCFCGWWKRFLYATAKLTSVTSLDLTGCNLRNGALASLKDMP